MSSTNRGVVRDLDDHYATPPEVARLICEALRHDGFITSPVVLLEPGCGEGSFLDAFQAVWPNAERIGIDLNPSLVAIAQERGHAAIVGDFLADRGGIEHDVSAAIGNPPFKAAEEFITQALNLVEPKGIVAMVQRLNFLGGAKRYKSFWDAMPGKFLRHVYIMPLRVGFTPDGLTDSIEYGIFVFQRGYTGHTTFNFLDNTGTENKWRGQSWHWRRAK